MTLQSRQVILDILDSLGFEHFVQKRSPHYKLSSDSFDKLTQLEFRLIFYFLFSKLNRELCQKRFRNVFPSRDIQQETEFRKIAFDWINELNRKDQKWNDFGTILPISFQRLSGPPFVRLLLKFSHYVLHHCVCRVKMPVELKAKLSDSKREDLEDFFNDYHDRVRAFECELDKYHASVCLQSRQMEKSGAEWAEESSLLDRYGSLQQIELANARLGAELGQIVKYLTSIKSAIRNSKDLMLMMTSQQAASAGAKLDVDAFAVSLVKQLRQFDQVAHMLNSSPQQWTSAFENSGQMKETSERITSLLHQSAANLRVLEERRLQLRDQIMSCQVATHYKSAITEYLEPLFHLKLTIS